MPAGDVVFAAEATGGLRGTMTPATARRPAVDVAAVDDSGWQPALTCRSARPGGQHARFALARSNDWYAVVATFDPLL